MANPTNLLPLYGPLVLWVSTGLVLGRTLPPRVPQQLGQGLFWVGVPAGIAIFLRQADLSSNIWLAPAIAWLAVGLGAGLAWVWIRQPWYQCGQGIGHRFGLSSPLWGKPQAWPTPTQGSFINASMLGNTGYLGYPIVLAVVGPNYFAWAVFYDTLGSTLASYGLAVVLASHFGHSATNAPTPHSFASPLQNAIAQLHHIGLTLLQTPAIWGFILGLLAKSIVLPQGIESGLKGIAWGVIASALLLLGMRLSQLTAWSQLRLTLISLSIKMFLVPLLIGLGLKGMGLDAVPLLVLVLQMGMPPAFATLIIAEAYGLDRDLAVTSLAIGSVMILAALPLWLALFAP